MCGVERFTLATPPRQHEASRCLGVSSRRFTDSQPRLLIRVDVIGAAVRARPPCFSLHSVCSTVFTTAAAFTTILVSNASEIGEVCMVSLASGEGFGDAWHCSVLVFCVYILFSALKLVSEKYSVNFLTVVLCFTHPLYCKSHSGPGEAGSDKFRTRFSFTSGDLARMCFVQCSGS